MLLNNNTSNKCTLLVKLENPLQGESFQIIKKSTVKAPNEAITRVRKIKKMEL